MKDSQRKKLMYERDYNIEEKSLMKKENEGEDQEEPEEANLTASPLPGTTVGLVRIEASTLGIRVKF